MTKLSFAVISYLICVLGVMASLFLGAMIRIYESSECSPFNGDHHGLRIFLPFIYQTSLWIVMSGLLFIAIAAPVFAGGRRRGPFLAVLLVSQVVFLCFEMRSGFVNYFHNLIAVIPAIVAVLLVIWLGKVTVSARGRT